MHFNSFDSEARAAVGNRLLSIPKGMFFIHSVCIGERFALSALRMRWCLMIAGIQTQRDERNCASVQKFKL